MKFIDENKLDEKLLVLRETIQLSPATKPHLLPCVEIMEFCKSLITEEIPDFKIGIKCIVNGIDIIIIECDTEKANEIYSKIAKLIYGN